MPLRLPTGMTQPMGLSMGPTMALPMGHIKLYGTAHGTAYMTLGGLWYSPWDCPQNGPC